MIILGKQTYSAVNNCVCSTLSMLITALKATMAERHRWIAKEYHKQEYLNGWLNRDYE